MNLLTEVKPSKTRTTTILQRPDRLHGIQVSMVQLTTNPQIFDFGPFRLDTITRQLCSSNLRLSLTAKTFDILQLLVENGGRVITKNEFISKIWPDRDVEESNLTVRIFELRRLLRSIDDEKYIETVPGCGYRFVSHVESVDTSKSPGAAEAAFKAIDPAQDLGDGTRNSEAHHNYLKARYFWNLRSVADIHRSMTYFRRAISENPDYALAHAGLADVYRALSNTGVLSPRIATPKARAAALTALKIDDHLSDGYVSLGEIKSCFDWDWTGAEDAFKTAIKLDKNNAAAHHYYAILLAKLGRLDKAVEEIHTACKCNPISTHVQLASAKILYLQGRHDLAIRHINEILELSPNYGPAHGLMGMILLEKRRYDLALPRLKSLIAFSEVDYPTSIRRTRKSNKTAREADTEALGLIGYGYAMAGEIGHAQQMLRRLSRRFSKRHVEPHAVAMVHLGLGDRESAIHWLERAFHERMNSLTYLKVWPVFSKLKGDPRFHKLIEGMGLNTEPK